MCLITLQKGEDMPYKVTFYDLSDGSFPAYDFIEEQSPKMNQKIYRTIGLLEAVGPQLRMPYSKHLDDGIFELRMELGSDITRVLYFFVVDKKVVLTHGFVKKTQKTPPSEIVRAKKYRDDYLARHKED